MHRRELFGRIGSLFDQEAKSSYIRPPYFEDKKSFYIHCQECEGLCAKACEESIITILKDKTPTLDFSKRGCTYCDKCALACTFGVLKTEYKAPIDALITIHPERCMSWANTICFSCKEPCLEDAIVFTGLFCPVIDTNRCTRCGFCLSKCPTDAIEIKRSSNVSSF